jgi:hypothetical protein
MKNINPIILLLFLSFVCNTLTAQNDKIKADSRALKYFTIEQVKSMEPYQIEQMNYLFGASFEVDDKTEPCDECPEINLEEIDIKGLSRSQTERTKFYLTDPGHPIILYSWEEVNEKLEEIELKYKQ